MDDLLQKAFEQAIRADEVARSAHERLDRTDEAMTSVRTDIATVREALSELKIAVGKINTKVGFAASIGGLVGSAVVAALVRFIA